MAKTLVESAIFSLFITGFISVSSYAAEDSSLGSVITDAYVANDEKLVIHGHNLCGANGEFSLVMLGTSTVINELEVTFLLNLSPTTYALSVQEPNCTGSTKSNNDVGNGEDPQPPAPL